MSNYTIWGLFGPVTWAFWLAALALLAAMMGQRGRGWSNVLLGAAVTIFIILGIAPTGHWLARELEAQFAPISLDQQDVDHIVVLAGSEELLSAALTGRPEFNGAGDRVVEGAAIARVKPNAKLWIVGGVTAGGPLSDADWTRLAWRRLGIPERQIAVLNGTLDTCGNAQGIANQQLSGNILLVTSAVHMPRAKRCFDARRVLVIPYPVDFLTVPGVSTSDWLTPNILGNLTLADRALHEWVGMAVYRLRGRL